MCELFAVSAAKKLLANPYLNVLREHSHNHPDGWGMAVFDEKPMRFVKEAVPAYESALLEKILLAPIETASMIGHIRLATRGELIYENCHPFTGKDDSGRSWTVAHNGTIFESALLDAYKPVQKGSGDSERIILHILNEVNKLNESCGAPSAEERFKLMDEIILSIARPNKLNLMVYDGELLYIHTNMKGTLFKKCVEEGLVFATTPLDDEKSAWEPLEMMRLFAYKDGQRVFSGTKHDYEYFLEP